MKAHCSTLTSQWSNVEIGVKNCDTTVEHSDTIVEHCDPTEETSDTTVEHCEYTVELFDTTVEDVTPQWSTVTPK